MSIQGVNLMWSRNDGSIESRDGRKRTGQMKVGYQVFTDPTDTINDVFTATDPVTGVTIPNTGEQYLTFPQIRCRRKNPKQITPVYWTVDVEYEGELGPGSDDNPLNDPPEKSWGKITSDEPIDEDKDGNPIVTPNDEPIDGVTKKISDLVLTVKRNYASIDLPATHAYLHSVNSDVFAGFAPGVGRLDAFSAKEVFADTVPGGGFWEVTAGIIFRHPYRTTADKAWHARVRNEGFYVKDTVTGQVRHAWDEMTKQWVTSPVLLKLNGEQATASTATWLEIPRYDPLPYNALGLL